MNVSKPAKLFLTIVVGVILLTNGCSASVGYLIGYRERESLKAMVIALREAADGSCGLKDNGPRMVCWMEHGSVKIIELKSSDRIGPARYIKRGEAK